MICTWYITRHYALIISLKKANDCTQPFRKSTVSLVENEIHRAIKNIKLVFRFASHYNFFLFFFLLCFSSSPHENFFPDYTVHQNITMGSNSFRVAHKVLIHKCIVCLFVTEEIPITVPWHAPKKETRPSLTSLF